LVFALLSGGLVFAAPPFLLNLAAHRRRDKLEAQVLDVIGSISATSKAGMNLLQSVEEVATRMPPPISQEFAMILERVRTGQPLEAALEACDRRLDIPNLSLVIQSILVNQERGGRLPELLEKISLSLREIHRVEERVKTETSGIKLSSKLMAAMPLVIGFLLYLASPDHILMLFNTLLGNLILLAVVALDAIGFSIIKKLGDLEV
jgi:tight adherence protein B